MNTVQGRVRAKGHRAGSLSFRAALAAALVLGTFVVSAKAEVLSKPKSSSVQPHKTTAAQSSLQGSGLWQQLGPTMITNNVIDSNTAQTDYSAATGRINSMDADASGTIYAGSDGGGVWKSTDSGGSWTPLTDNIPAPKVTALRVDPNNVQVVFAALNTGEHDIGGGLYRSDNAGATWAEVGSAVFGTQFITAIRVDPSNDNYVFASLQNGSTEGVAVSADNGVTWTDPTSSGSLAGQTVSDLAIAGNGTLFAAVPGQGIYRSTDHGGSWTILRQFVSSDTLKITIAPSNNQVLYVEQANQGYATAIYRSVDGGSTWNNICDPAAVLCVPNKNPDGSHQVYDYIAVDSTNPDVVFVGLVDLWETTNGTSASPTWTDALASANHTANSLHVDQHGFVQTSAGYFFANDGGVYRSTDGGQTFLFSGQGLVTAQFHSGSTGSPGSRVLAGGVQDNGVIASPDGSSWSQGLGGDGNSALLDPQNSQNLFADTNGLTPTSANIYYSTNGGTQWTPATPPGLSQDGTSFFAPLVLKPGSSTTLYLGARHIWTSTDGARSWQEQSAPPAFANACPNSTACPFVQLAANASGELFGTDGSHNAVSTDGGSTWQPGVTSPCGSCSSLAIDNNGTLYETNIIYGNQPTGQLFVSHDGGANWNEIDSGLPAVAFHSVVVDPTNSSRIFVGTDAGVFISRDAGATWKQLGAGLPDVAVSGLAVASDGSILTAFTLGRGVWSVKIPPANAVEDLPACTANTLPANDDSSTPSVPLPFSVNFYGKSYSSLYVNNNGNVTFDAPLPTYTPFGLTATQTAIIAPFFADVDTRGPGSGVVTYGGAPASGTNPAYFCVNWVNVGYYNSHTDKTNSFQLILIDRSAQTGVAGDFDAVFNYDTVQWETGDASGGVGGLGGTSARVGYSNGTNRSAEIFGSGINGALLDGGLDALTSSSQNSTTVGQYIFPIRNGNSTGGSFHGTITDSSAPPVPVSGATLQFCTVAGASQACGIASSNALGNYSVTGLPAGQYDVRVSPPAGSSLFERDLGPIGLPDQATVQLDAALSGPRGLTPGTTITSLHTNPDGTPVLDWNTTNTLTTHGCVGGAASYTMTIANNQYGNPVSGPMAETPGGSGTYAATIPPLHPQYGPAQVVISITCPDPAQNQTITFDVYIDPSGSVVDQSGNPVPGATVTLFRADAASGPFTEVPAGSSIMSPANRLNPDTSTASGRFGWDVLQGYYEIRASKAGCTAPGNPSQGYAQSPVEQIPPPAANLVLTLQCNQVTTTSTLTSSLNPSAYGQPVTFTDTVTAGSATPSGMVTFYDGATPLGNATLSAAGTATVATSTLTVGNHSVKAVYAGSGGFLGSTSNTVLQTVNYTSCITGSRDSGLSVRSGQAICVTSTGRVNGTTIVHSGGLLYVNGGTLNDGITVRTGGALFIKKGTITGGIISTGAKALSVCGARVSDVVSASGSVGFVLIGDGGDDRSPRCAGNTINGDVTLTGNTAGVEVSGNTVSGTVMLTSNSGAGPTTEDAKPEIEANHISESLACANNNPAPTNDGRPNTVNGSRTGQCSARGF